MPQFRLYRKNNYWLENAACGQPIKLRKNINKKYSNHYSAHDWNILLLEKMIKNCSQSASCIHQTKHASQMQCRNCPGALVLKI